jgi:transketolase
MREQAMGAIVNGLAAHRGPLPFGANFFFSHHMRSAIRVASLIGLHVVLVFTHDSIAVGEDGLRHQPADQPTSRRAMPNLTLIRAGVTKETAVGWTVAIETRSRPVLLVLTRQYLRPLIAAERPAPKASAEALRRSASVLWESPTTETRREPELILLASGSERTRTLAAAECLHAEDVGVRCVAMPSWDLFGTQPQRHRDEVLPPTVRAGLAVALGAPQGWHRCAGERGEVMGIERFGAPAPASALMREFEFANDGVLARAHHPRSASI